VNRREVAGVHRKNTLINQVALCTFIPLQTFAPYGFSLAVVCAAKAGLRTGYIGFFKGFYQVQTFALMFEYGNFLAACFHFL
jgi:hypothetical protein